MVGLSELELFLVVGDPFNKKILERPIVFDDIEHCALVGFVELDSGAAEVRLAHQRRFLLLLSFRYVLVDLVFPRVLGCLHRRSTLVSVSRDTGASPYWRNRVHVSRL